MKVVPGVSGHDKLQLITAGGGGPMSQAQEQLRGADGQVGDAEEGSGGAQRRRPAGDLGQPGGVGDQDVEGDHGQHGRPG